MRTKIIALILAVVALVALLVAVNTRPSEAAVVAFKVSDSSEKSMRVCDLPGGKGRCGTVKPGKYSLDIFVESARQDKGCEFWVSGERKYKRDDETHYRNFYGLISKRTVALRNCRTTGRGDIAPAGRAGRA